jgi:hypothetical protein
MLLMVMPTTSPLPLADVAEVVTVSFVMSCERYASSHEVVAYLLRWGSRPKDG